MIDLPVLSTAEERIVENDPKTEKGVIIKRVFSTPTGTISSVIILLIIIIALLAPLISPHDPLKQNIQADTLLNPPNREHLLGTDELGRDMLSRVIFGSRISLTIAGLSVGLAVLIGMTLGLITTLGGGAWDYVIMRLTDALMAFPVMILAISISLAIGRGISGLILAIAVVNIPIFTRLTRGQALQIREDEFVQASIALGASKWRIAFKHIIPNIINPLIVQATVTISFAIVTEAGLSFLGLGIQQPTPSWGIMISTAKSYLTNAPHMMFVPSIALFITVLSLNLFGDALCDAINPKQGKSKGA